MSPALRSAGLLPFRFRHDLEVLLAHPGGPYFQHRGDGWWSLIKGLVKEGEADEDAAAREFSEETGWDPPGGLWIPMGDIILRSRKVVVAWAVAADLDPGQLNPGHFLIGDRSYPEIDRVEWFTPEGARRKLNQAQGVFIDRLVEHLQNEHQTS
ncbi:MAG: NUDIX domain-containing protein [Acidimicrobiia bacterium]|nr:NUDIX domain-containing protein [Acidimicrobiia bacterium]MDH3463503.1 NUDIX domain-containing protein [Acidimicrobiia bacterium]